MTARYVNLGYGRNVSLGAYVAGWRMAIAADPATSVKVVPGRYDGGTIAEALRELRRGMHDRINRHDPAFGRGRKWHHNWQRTMMQTAHAVNTPRLVVRWVPFELRARLAHRLWTDG